MPFDSECHTNDFVLSCFIDQRINRFAQRENWWSLSVTQCAFCFSSFKFCKWCRSTSRLLEKYDKYRDDCGSAGYSGHRWLLWGRATFKAILKASQWVFEFPRHWGTICPTCKERARTPLTMWLFSGAESYFYGSKCQSPISQFFFFKYGYTLKI